MMYSMEKCLGRNGTGTPPEDELFAGARSGLGPDGAAPDDVALASAVAAVSHEIGDILKDELGDAERADRIGAELADLSAELGLLAGLHDGDTQQDFPTLLKLASAESSPYPTPRDITLKKILQFLAADRMSSRQIESSASSSSSSSYWSRTRAGLRRHARPRPPRRKPIAKGKEVSRRRSVAARRAASMRVRRVEVLSDASDVGADSDSDDQWTELEDNTASGSGSGSTSSSSDATSKSGADLDEFRAIAAEPPQLGQFLLPLITNVPNTIQFRIRHDDIVQLLATEEEEQNPPDVSALNEALMNDEPDELEDIDIYPFEEPPVTPEEEATLLHYVCGGERGSLPAFEATEEWVLGVFHSWCEVSALIYTLIGTDASAARVCGPWAYRVFNGCQCQLCLSSVRGTNTVANLLRDLLWALAHGGSTVPNAAHIMRALQLSGDAPLSPENWDLPRLKRIQFSDEGAAIIHNQLVRYSTQNDIARQIITNICSCNVFDKPMEKEHAVERFIRILECFKSASIVHFKIEMIPLNDDPETIAWINSSRLKLEQYLLPYQNSDTLTRIYNLTTSTKPIVNQWEDYVHMCVCPAPKIIGVPERKKLLKSVYCRMALFGLKHSSEDANDTELPLGPTPILPQWFKRPVKSAAAKQQQGPSAGAKPPESHNTMQTHVNEVAGDTESENEQTDPNVDLDDSSFLTVTDSDENSGASLGLSHSSLDSASELLLAAAHAVDSDTEHPPTQLCRTVRHLMRNIASIERHMDTVLKQCDEWPTGGNDVEARKQMELGLSAVDRKLMAIYRRLPDVHRRQVQLYRKQKKLSTVCMQLVGGQAPVPPAPGTPPPAPRPLPCRALCPEYHLQRFKEVRRKVMHMRDQQLYYHRLRMWLEDQLKQDRDSLPESKKALLESLPRRKRRPNSPKFSKLSATTRRKLKPTTIRILQLLKQKAIASHLLNDRSDDSKEAEPPEAFTLERDDNVSDTDTIVGEKDIDMNQVLAALAQMALSPDKRILQAIADLKGEYANAKPTTTSSEAEEYPEAVSPPLQEMSPTAEPAPTFPPKPTQRIINKFTEEFNAQPELNAPLNARQPIKDKSDSEKTDVVTYKDPNLYKYVTFGIEIKKAMEECQDIINSYNNIKPDKEEGPLSLEQICEVMMRLDKHSVEFLDQYIDDNPVALNSANTKLAELVEHMPQILANMPEIAGEFANASFELPEFASIMNSLPEASSETQLTPETLKQIRELKLTKVRDSIKVTKNTAKRKISRKIKNNTEIVGTMAFENDSKEMSELLIDDKELQDHAKNDCTDKEDFKNVLYSISAQVVVNKVHEYEKATNSPDLAKLEQQFFAFPRSCITDEMYDKAATLFDNSVKETLSMDELKVSLNLRFNTWKLFVASEFKSIPVSLLESEIEHILNKFYLYIQDLAGKQTQGDRDKIIEKLEDCRKEHELVLESASQDSMQQMTKVLVKQISVSAGTTFDLLLMKMSKMTGERKEALKNMRFKYVDVLKRCAESQPLVTWILNDPDSAANHIQELMGFAMKATDKPMDSSMTVEQRRECFMGRLKSINKYFMDNIPKKALSGDEWLVMLYKLEQFERKIKDALMKFSPTANVTQSATPATQSSRTTQASEAVILAAKGLSKIINNANHVKVKKPASPVTPATTVAGAPVVAPTLPAPTVPAPPIPVAGPAVVAQPVASVTQTKALEEKPEVTNTAKAANPKVSNTKCTNSRRDVIVKCEGLIAQKGNKVLKDSFDAIKAYLAGEVSKPENYHEHVMSIVSNLDYSALDDEMVEVLKYGGISITPPKGDNNPEELAKYSAQALRNAKQALNAVAFKNLARNGQSKSEGDISNCDVPSSECKYTSDCICRACKRDASLNFDDMVRIRIDEVACKAELEDKQKKEVKEAKKAVVKSKPMPKQCENATHQQHVCKVGHTTNGNACTGDGGDQHCTCCYCTVFGHAPPLTTPVPRNFNETRERLRSILNKKKQLCKTANGEQNPQEARSPQPERKASQSPAESPQPKPPALPKTLPPNLTATAQAKRQAIDMQQRLLADKLSKLAVSDKPDMRPTPTALLRPAPVQGNVPPSLKAEGKVNPNAMEQIRLQQLKQQQQAQYQQQMAQQKKPEPIYDLPIHNKPPQQQQQIRMELEKQALKTNWLHQKLIQNPIVKITAQSQPTTPQPATTYPTHTHKTTVTTTVTLDKNFTSIQSVQKRERIPYEPVATQPTNYTPMVPVLQKPPMQMAPRKPPPQELHQKLLAKQQQAKLASEEAETDASKRIPRPVQAEEPMKTRQQTVQPQPATQLTDPQTVQQKPATQETVQQKPATQPVQQKPAAQQQVQQKPATQQPAQQKPATQQPAQQIPATQQTAQQKPTTTQKPAQQPATQQPAQQKPAAQQPAQQKPAAQQPAQQKPATQQPQRPQPQEEKYMSESQWAQMKRFEDEVRGRQPNSVSLSSRDTSVFSTSSGTEESQPDDRSEDTRDLDALLQYIEGPARHVDRGKKKAKKQRQKAKKTEEKLEQEFTQLKVELSRIRIEAEALRVAHGSARRRCDETRRALQLISQAGQNKTRKKQNKLNPVQKQQIQVLAEKVGEMTALMNTTAKELQSAENRLADYSSRLRQCDKEIIEARAMQGKKTINKKEEIARSQQSQLQAQLEDTKALEQHLKQLQIQQAKQRQLQMNQDITTRLNTPLLHNDIIAQADRYKAAALKAATNCGSYSSASSTNGSVSSTGADRGGSSSSASGTVLVRRCGNDVTVSVPGGRGETPLGQLVMSNRHLITMTHEEEEPPAPPPPKPEPRKSTQTWEQALAHINQVAKGSKDKDKPKKQSPAPTKPEPVKPDIVKPAALKPEPKKDIKPAPEETAPLSKKQRKKLAQQQAEEEERFAQEQQAKQDAKEAKNKKAKKSEPDSLPVRVEPLTKKAEKKLEHAKRVEDTLTKKEAKRERKLEKKAEKKEEKKAEKKEEKKAKELEAKEKEKENKPEKNAQAVKPKTPVPMNAPPMTKKERKREAALLQQKQQQLEKEKPKAQVTITPVEAVSKKCTIADPDKPAACSIMEQLSCGIQVSELRLPPGITLTRVQPSEKKEPPAIKSVPLWKANQLAAAPTPVARPVPVINADPSMMMFSTAHPEPPKPIIVADPQPIGKSKKAKKKAKKAAAAEADTKPDPTKIVTLRNPMFHPNLPPVQISTANSPPVVKKPEIRLPDPIPMPPNACQATITPTSNGMYTIRNPLMSMMHQQTMMGVRNPTPPFNQTYYNNYQPQPPGQYVLETRTSPKPDDFNNRIMNLASFTQKNDEGYSLFSAPDNSQKSFLSPEYYGEDNPKPVVSPNPIGTRPERNFESESLFACPTRVEPIGTPPRGRERNESRGEYTGLYTPFPRENQNLFQNALFNEKVDSPPKADDPLLTNGDLPYFQRLRVGSKLNNEVTIHHVTESKFYRQEPPHQPLEELPTDDSLFSRPLSHAWSEPLYPAPNPLKQGIVRDTPPPGEEPRFGAVGTRPLKEPEMNLYHPDKHSLSSLEACEREVESFKRYEWYFNADNKVPHQDNMKHAHN